ncbi:Transcription factor WhiB [Nocardioides sp. YR527]|uniref:WhiB family transcriptional regulator n=1 Tax=Nocardioides sp. YR527 TaxID=1881028 RepID=UPI00088EF513|nr:WhiB family transcriptional regulator [Nocardioides sp. YR527]SDL15390.1 Transcription factor WhiB [Nocardioides sp. YR527]
MTEPLLFGPATSAAWMDFAHCRDVDPARMQPDAALRTSVEDTKAEVCGPCPVRRECFQHAKDQGEAYGIHAGVWFGEDPVWLQVLTCPAPACGKEFIRSPKAGGQRYCSQKCRRAADRARSKAA